MKYLSKIGLPLLMIGLLAMAFILPKFVQKAAPAKSPSHIAQTSELEEIPSPSELESDSPDLSEFDISRITGSDSSPNNGENGYAKLIQPFLDEMEAGNLDQAEKALVSFGSTVPESVQSGLRFSLNSARETEQARAAVAEEKKQAEQALAEANRMKEEKTAAEAQLAKANEAAKSAELETAKLREEISSGNTAAADSEKEPIELPTQSSVSFAFNSAVIPGEAYGALHVAATALQKEQRLGIQLRGYADSVGRPEYNAILSKARSQAVKDGLLAKGIPADRIELVPFGESVSPEGRNGSFRRVDLIFVER